MIECTIVACLYVYTHWVIRRSVEPVLRIRRCSGPIRDLMAQRGKFFSSIYRVVLPFVWSSAPAVCARVPIDCPVIAPSICTPGAKQIKAHPRFLAGSLNQQVRTRIESTTLDSISFTQGFLFPSLPLHSILAFGNDEDTATVLAAATGTTTIASIRLL
jgi:hypothetical protein